MGILTFALLIILVFTALQIERVLKDIRNQNKEILEALQRDEKKGEYISNPLEKDN